MPRSFFLTAAGIVLMAAACRPAAPDAAPPQADSALPIEAAAAAGLPEEASPGPAPQASSPLVGSWELATPGRPRGMRLTLAVDSAKGTEVFGRLVHYMSGDVGVDAARFAPFVGDAAGDAVRISIRARDGSTGFLFAGTLRGDTVFLNTFAIGPDTVRGSEVGEVLVRREGR